MSYDYFEAVGYSGGSDRDPGYALGVGVEITILPALLTATPAVRYVDADHLDTITWSLGAQIHFTAFAVGASVTNEENQSRDGDITGVTAYGALRLRTRRDLRPRLAHQAARPLRVASNKEQLDYIPGSPVPAPDHTLDTYWGLRGPAGMPSATMPPPTPTIDRVVIIEVSIHDVKTSKLQWTGTLESINPGSPAELGAEIAQAVGAKLRAQGLIP